MPLARHRMRLRTRAALGVVALSAAWSAPAGGQLTGAQQAPERPGVFFDCAGPSCDLNYYRTQIGWVDWIRDPQVANVHVLMSSQSNGAGGRQYLLDFIGVGPYELYENRLTYFATPTSTNRETLDAIAHVLAIGLANFGAAIGVTGLVYIEGVEEFSILPSARLVSQDEVDDPWDFWVFRINANGNVDGEATRSTKRIDTNFSASRVTPTWKLNFRGNINFNQRDIELTNAPDFRDTRHDWGLTQFTAYALADHWSLGWQFDARRSTSSNQRLRAEITPGIEYSFFPYEDATRRSLTLFYKIGPAWRDYFEETVFGETDEVTWDQSLELELSMRQPWGNASVRVLGSHFLHDFDLYRLETRGNIDVRVVRGISLNANGSIGWVNDQIYLSAEGATDQEALLNLQQQAQDFTYSMRVGISIQFGSIFNNVVNNRLGGGGFGGFFR